MEELRLETVAAAVACGTAYTFLLDTDGKIAACGSNYLGQLGFKNAASRRQFTPVRTSALVVQVACGTAHTFLRFEDGTLAATGSNCCGQLGLGDSTCRYRYAFTAVPDVTAVAEVACGSRHAVVRFVDGSIASCGDNYRKTVASYTYRFVPIPAPLPVVQVACCGIHTFLRFEDGSVADSNGSDRIQDSAAIAEVACGQHHVFLLFEDGTVAARGDNDFGQLGLGDDVDRSSFVSVPVAKPVAQVVCGDDLTFLRFEDGTLASCGWGVHRIARTRELRRALEFPTRSAANTGSASGLR